ncbi:MAG: hypothetical protein QF829_03870, partial [Candidatus Hydrothermarchaeota archaeon]|nr:hypothetical protein [Candidatus Hydrothermarchaeota archaeon]
EIPLELWNAWPVHRNDNRLFTIPIPVEVIALSTISVGAPLLPTAVFASIGAIIGAGMTYLIGRVGSCWQDNEIQYHIPHGLQLPRVAEKFVYHSYLRASTGSSLEALHAG